MTALTAVCEATFHQLLVRTASRWSETKRGIRLPKFPHFRPTGKPDYFTAMADV
jgi:hypothetical protein